MRELLERLMHRGQRTNKEIDEIEDQLAPEASPEKLAEAEAWTRRMRAETEANKREFTRYLLEAQLETGVSRLHGKDNNKDSGDRRS